MTRIDLVTGAAIPFASPYAAGEPLAWSTTVSFPADPHSAVDAVLLASSRRPELRLEDARSGTALGTWSLPEPVRFPDSGQAFQHGDDGRVVFVSGRRTVLSFDPSTGVQALWKHHRDLPPQAPVLIDDQLMLAEDPCITVVDLTGGGRTEIGLSASGTVCAPVAVANGALFARAHGKVVVIGRGDVRAAVRLPTHVEQLFPGDGIQAYTIGKGHLTALDVSTSER